MKKILYVLVAAVALVIAAPASAKTVTVSITAAGFVPSTVEIQQGDTVTWRNADTKNHQVASGRGGFASPVLAPGASYSRTFTAAARIQYEDPLHKNEKGTIVVSAAPASVTLNASRKLLVYGGRTTLTGTVSTQQANEAVTVWAQVCGQSTFTRVTQVTTTTGGAYSYTIQPLKNTTYQVRYKNVASPNVTVRVKPAIRLGKVAPRRFTVTVRAADSLAGKIVVLQRFNATTRAWVKVRTATLRANTTGVAPTVVSSVTLTTTVKARTKLRIVMTQLQVGGCYAPGLSNAILA